MTDHAIANEGGEVVYVGSNDLDAVRWFLRHGRRGDHFRATGEMLSEVANNLYPDIYFRYDESGQVVDVNPDAVCDNCGREFPPHSTDKGRFCDVACAEAYDLA